MYPEDMVKAKNNGHRWSQIRQLLFSSESCSLQLLLLNVM